MNFKISQMTAYALLDHTKLDADLAEQIINAPDNLQEPFD